MHNIIAKRVASLQPTAVNRVLREAREVQAEGKELVSLMRGQPDTPTAPHIVKAAQEALQRGRTGYPDNLGEPALRKAVAEKLKRDNGITYDPDNEILITDGATAGLCAAIGTLVNPGDEVLVPDPVYDAYSGPIRLWGGNPIAVRSSIEHGRFCLKPDSLRQSCTAKSRLLLLNSPWNPVGTVFTRDELQGLVEVCVERNLFILSDEIYETLTYDGRRAISPAALGAEARGRTLIVNSLSKTYAMTGWRVGYCAGPAQVIQAMLLVWQQSSRGPATFVQDAAAYALSGDQDSVKQMTKEYQARRDYVLRELQGIKGVTPLVPEGGLFVMVDVGGLGPSSDEIRRRLLHDHGVVVIHGAAYGPAGEGTLRVSFAAGGDVLKNGIARLKKGLISLSG